MRFHNASRDIEFFFSTIGDVCLKRTILLKNIRSYIVGRLSINNILFMLDYISGKSTIYEKKQFYTKVYNPNYKENLYKTKDAHLTECL